MLGHLRLLFDQDHIVFLGDELAGQLVPDPAGTGNDDFHDGSHYPRLGPPVQPRRHASVLSPTDSSNRFLNEDNTP